MTRLFEHRWFAPVLLTSVLLCAGCSRGDRTPLLVGAASSLRPPLEEAVVLFSKSHLSVDIVITYAGSGTIRRQIEFGAPIDVFLSAATEHIDSLIADGLVAAESRKTFASNTLLVVTPVRRAPLAGVFDLRLPAVAHIAIGEPRTVPAGRYAQQVLDRLGLEKDVVKKLVYTKDVTQALTYVSSNIVDAGFVYVTDVAGMSSVRVLAVLPDSLHDPILYEGIIVSTTRHGDEAARFLEYLRSDSVQTVFFQRGFPDTRPW